MKLADDLRSRPLLYLPIYNGTLEVSALHANCLNAVFGCLDLGYPSFIQFAVAHPYFTITVINSRLTGITEDIGKLIHSLSLEKLSVQDAARLPCGLRWLATLIWFTEYCLTDLTIENNIYRQAFRHGHALDKPILVGATDHEPPRLGFCFTVPNGVFERTQLSQSSLNQMLLQWQQGVFSLSRTTERKFPQLKLMWQTHDEYDYSVQIIPISTYSEVVDPIPIPSLEDEVEIS